MTTFQTELRVLRGLRTQTEFAKHLGVSRATIAVWETGRARPSIALARKLVERGMDPNVVLEAALNRASGSAA